MKYIAVIVMILIGGTLIRTLLGSSNAPRRAALLEGLRKYGKVIHRTAGILAVIVLGLLVLRLMLMALRLW
jgi:hypothetical protein